MTAFSTATTATSTAKEPDVSLEHPHALFMTNAGGHVAMVFLGVAITLAVTHREGVSPDPPSRSARAGRTVVSDDGETAHVLLNIPSSDASAKLVIHQGVDRAAIATFIVYHDGLFVLEPSNSDPARFTVVRTAAGMVEMSLLSDSACFGRLVGLEARPRPDGAIELIVKNDQGSTVYSKLMTSPDDSRTGVRQSSEQKVGLSPAEPAFRCQTDRDQ
jgi:hypothetical protein